MKTFLYSVAITFFVLHFNSDGIAQTPLHLNNTWVFGSGEIVDAAYSPDGNYLATIGSLGIIIWDAETLIMAQHYPYLQNLNELKWAPNSKKLFVAEMIILDGNEQSFNNYVVDTEFHNFIQIQSNIQWYFWSTSTRLNLDLLLPVHNNSVNFANLKNEILTTTIDNQIEVFNLEDGSLIESIDFGEWEAYAAGFTSNDDVWVSKRKRVLSIFPEYDNQFLFYDRITNNETLIRSFEHFESLFMDITFDSKAIIWGIQRYITSGGYNVVRNAFLPETVHINDSVNIGKGVGYHNNDIVQYYPNRYRYQPLLKQFISLNPKINTSSIQVTNIDNNINRDIIHFDVLSTFMEPFNENASSFLIGEFYPNPTRNYIPQAGPLLPNYGLYDINWENVQYEHLLPNTAPEVITFKPGENNQFFTHTNRKSRQYKFAKELTEDNPYPNINLPLIPNKFNQPVSQFWSPINQTMVDEVLDKPFHDLGDFSADGSLFASPVGNGSGQINIWDTNSWETANELMLDSTETIHHIGFSPNDAWFVSTQNTVDVWDTASGERVSQFFHNGSSVFHADFNESGTQLLSAGEDGSVMQWNIASQTGNVVVQEASAVVFAHYVGNASVLYVLEDGTAKVFDTQNQSVVQQYQSRLGDHSYRSIKLLPNEHILFVGNEVWDLAGGDRIATIAENARPILDLQVSDDGEWVATRHSDYTARVWQTSSILHDTTDVKDFSIHR